MQTTEYEIPLREDVIGEDIILTDHRNLDITLVSFRNSLCPSFYDSKVKCFWEGDLEVTLNVNGKFLVINDHDKKNNRTSFVNTNEGVYVFQGLFPKVVNKNTSLVFSVSHHI